jgi:hypothetical protein
MPTWSAQPTMCSESLDWRRSLPELMDLKLVRSGGAEPELRSIIPDSCPRQLTVKLAILTLSSPAC